MQINHTGALWQRALVSSLAFASVAFSFGINAASFHKNRLHSHKSKS